MTYEPTAPAPKADPTQPAHPPAAPVAQPMPKMDGAKPVPPGKDQVEKFNVATDTEGGD
jgi:hypothetical protein